MTEAASAHPPPPNGEGGDPLTAVVNKIKLLNAELKKLCDDIAWEPLPEPAKLEETRELIRELVEYVQRQVVDREEWFQEPTTGGAPTRADIVKGFTELKTAAQKVGRALHGYEQVLRHHQTGASRRSDYSTGLYAEDERTMEEEGTRIAASVQEFLDNWIHLTQAIAAVRGEPHG